MKRNILTIAIILAATSIVTCCANKNGDGSAKDTNRKGNIVEAQEADQPQVEDFILSTEEDGKQKLWHVHSGDGKAYADIIYEDGFWSYSQEGTFDGNRLRMKGNSLIGSIITLDITRTGDRFKGKQTIEDEGEKDVEDIELKVYEAAHPCKGHNINFDIIREYYTSPYMLVYKPTPGKYARFDLDGDSIAETLWVCNNNGVKSGAFFVFDPRSGHTEFVTPEGQETEAFIQGNVINAKSSGIEGSFTQRYYVIENNQVARVIEVECEYNGMTGEMDTSYTDITNNKTLTEHEYNDFVDTLVPEDITLSPQWTPFPATN